jgi:hypothetical protein
MVFGGAHENHNPGGLDVQTTRGLSEGVSQGYHASIDYPVELAEVRRSDGHL